jgi:type I restriction enzyme S subunit
MERQNWKVKRLSELVEFLDGKRVALKDSDRAQMRGDVPYYGANGQIDSVNKYIFDEPLVLLAEDGGHFGSKTKPIAYRVDGKSWVNNHAHVLKPVNGLNIDFLKWTLAFYDVTKFTTGSTRVKLTKGDAMKMQIPFPDLKTQQKIAATLEQADTARQKRKQANQLTKQFLQSAFLEMFGDPVRNEKGWEVKKVKSFVSNIISGWSAPSENREKIKGEFGVLKVSAVTYGIFKPEENKAVTKEIVKQKMVHPMKGDVLMTRANTQEFVAACCIVEQDYNDLFLSDKHWKIEIDQQQIVPWYFKFVISSDSFHQVLANKSTGTGGSMFNISKDKLLNTNFSIPPMTEQKRFASLVEQTEKLRSKQRESELELENLFQSLMQRYFG